MFKNNFPLFHFQPGHAASSPPVNSPYSNELCLKFSFSKKRRRQQKKNRTKILIKIYAIQIDHLRARIRFFFPQKLLQNIFECRRKEKKSFKFYMQRVSGKRGIHFWPLENFRSRMLNLCWNLWFCLGFFHLKKNPASTHNQKNPDSRWRPWKMDLPPARPDSFVSINLLATTHKRIIILD